METRVRQNLVDLGVHNGCRIGIAVSGGIDSMALLHCLCHLRCEMDSVIVAYHMEHGIRGARSLADMAFVKDECEKRGVEFIAARADIPALAAKDSVSMETAARAARYRFFDAQDADFIATAHHLDDVAETVLMNLIRGAGLAGLCGIPKKRGHYIRPLLNVSRREIEAYVQAQNIAYVYDDTNDDIFYTRNYIRREILPRMKSLNDGVAANIARTARLLAEDERALQNAADNADGIMLEDDGAYIDIDKLFAEDAAVQKRMIRLAVSRKFDLYDLESVHVEAALSLAYKAKTAARADLGRGLFAAVVYGKLMIGKNNGTGYNNKSVTLQTGQTAVFGGTRFECRVFRGDPEFAGDVEFFDAEAIKGARLRHRREGDRIAPLGLGGTKRLSDYLSDRKVPLHQRDDLIVLANGSEVFWVVGIGVSEKSKVGANSAVIQIKFTEI